LERRTFDLSKALEGVVGSYVALASEKHQRVMLSLTGTVLVEGDEHRIGQVIGNLLSNACKYTPEGGQIAVSCTETADEVVVAVQDTGPGIPGERVDRLFARYERLGTQSEAKGMGLGLAVARGIVALHGGRIWVESEVGKGSTFRFSLPKRDTAAARGR
jgi:signal transduction histidine kinase